MKEKMKNNGNLLPILSLQIKLFLLCYFTISLFSLIVNKITWFPFPKISLLYSGGIFGLILCMIPSNIENEDYRLLGYIIAIGIAIFSLIMAYGATIRLF